MAEMPHPQDFERFIDGIKDPEGEVVDAEFEMVEGEEDEIEELPDGSAVVHMKEFKGPKEDRGFYENLADSDEFDFVTLDGIASRYLDLVDKDAQAREQRDKQYEEGIKRTGLGNDAPGGATFSGASKVVHPVMAEACVDFAARAMKELFPAEGPVRTNIIGEITDQKEEIAERKRDYMNWQLTSQIEEFRDEQEQLLTQLPLGGSQFLKLWWDDKLKRPRAEFIPIDNILLPYAAANFYTTPRMTEKQSLSEWEFQKRIDSGMYRDTSHTKASMSPDKTASEEATEKIEGKEPNDNEDGERLVYHIETWLEIEEDGETGGESAPYILMIDSLDRKVLGLYRNWEEGDNTMSKLDWIIEFKFIPWRGAYAIGLPHLIGGLSAALTGSLRALLDSAHINNAATMLKLKGAKISGQSQSVEVTQVAEIEGAPGVDDIRKIAMPFPFNPPSMVLYQLLGWLTGAAKGVVTTAEEKIADVNSNTPVGTTQALIEQGAAVFSSIHSRLHNSQRRVFMVLQRLNRWYLDEQKRGDIVAELPVMSDDFKRNNDVLPVSDPHIFSETQRMAQVQAIRQMAKEDPDLFNRRAVAARALKQMKVPNIQELLPEYTKPIEMHAADENAAMAMGRIAIAYPRQDHLAHIVAHLSFAQDPMMGSNPIIAPIFIPKVLEHLKQHMMLWYTQRMSGYTVQAAGIKPGRYAESKVADEIDRTMAVASGHVAMDIQTVMAKFQPAITQLLKLSQQLRPKPPLQGDAQAVFEASKMETERRKAKDAQDAQLEARKIEQDGAIRTRQQEIAVAMNTEDNLTKERMETLDLTVQASRLRAEQEDTATALNDAVQRSLKGE